MTDESRIELTVSFQHFIRLHSLFLNISLYDSDMSGPWESMAAFFSTASPQPSLRNLSIDVMWFFPQVTESNCLEDVFESVFKNVEALDPTLKKFFKKLITLSFHMSYTWPREFDHKIDLPRIQFSSSTVEGALRKMLPNIPKGIDLSVVVVHHVV